MNSPVVSLGDQLKTVLHAVPQECRQNWWHAALAATTNQYVLSQLPPVPARHIVAADDQLNRQLASMAGKAERLGRSIQRLARVNGWGSAGSCPAGHDAKTPAVREQVCRVAAAGSGARQVARASARDTSARVSARQQAGGGVR